MDDIKLFRQLVSCNDGQPVTTSRKVAERFNKQHHNALKAIDNLKCSDEFKAVNFNFSYEINELANGKAERMCNMTKDGMAFLVMGFTGKEAAKWKEAYIAAFNWMAGMIQERREIDMLMGDFTRREAVSVSDGSFHGGGLAKRRIEKHGLREELRSLTKQLQIALDLVGAE